ncbi:hypothetical protein GZH53_04620 [Flavihumibacter sp. R14]|nr:hypothetical protein [Flavihumibacter soli]
MEVRLCLDCKGELRGRSDKKFCDDQCRSNYNNRQLSESTSYMRQVNSILKRNRRIMEELNPDGKIKISRKKLLIKGFNFEYFTNIYQTQSGKKYYFCYESGYLPLEHDEVLLVRKEDNTKQKMIQNNAER